jgi:hypothetical protein
MPNRKESKKAQRARKKTNKYLKLNPAAFAKKLSAFAVRNK